MNATLQTITTARTIHGNFDQREIAPQDLETILSAAVRAASASNRQTYSIVVLEDRELMKELCGYQGSRALLFCVDYQRIMALAAHLGYAYTPEGPVALVTGAVDTLLAAQNAALAAKSLGIDSLFTNGIHRKDIGHLYARLNLPEKYCFPLIMLVLGYPNAEPPYLKGRVQGRGIVHSGVYQPLSSEDLEQMVQLYDDPAAHLGLNETWRENGFKHYLDWFFTAWNGPRNAQKEQEVLDLLIRAGFLPAPTQA